MSNIILLLIIFVLPIIFFPAFYFTANATGLPVIIFMDGVSVIIVFLSTLCFYLSSSNNKTYFNHLFLLALTMLMLLNSIFNSALTQAIYISNYFLILLFLFPQKHFNNKP